MEDDECYAMVNSRTKCQKKAIWIYRQDHEDPNVLGPTYTQMCQQCWEEWHIFPEAMPENPLMKWYWSKIKKT